MQENAVISLRERKIYLSIECIAFSTLWKFFNHVFKAFHGYLHRQRIISCISLAILLKEKKKKEKYETPPDTVKGSSALYPFPQEMHAIVTIKSSTKVTCLYILPNVFFGTYHVPKSLVKWTSPKRGERVKKGRPWGLTVANSLPPFHKPRNSKPRFPPCSHRAKLSSRDSCTQRHCTSLKMIISHNMKALFK